MKTSREHTGRGWWVVLATCAALTACGGSETDPAAAGRTSALSSARTSSTAPASDSAASPDTATVPASKAVSAPETRAAASTEGRLLASNCFQCHGTNGTGGFDNIRGGEAQEITEFLTKTASKDIMAAHAQGYTPAQLQKIIAYLQQ